MSTAVLIDPVELARELGGESSLVVLDVRWRLDAPDGSADHAEAHIPGAVYVSLDDELSEHGAPTDGRHPLPSRERLQAAVRRWGLRPGDRVVAADDLAGMAAARAWWVLRAAGLADVRILDGGLRAWREAGLPLESSVTPEPGTSRRRGRARGAPRSASTRSRDRRGGVLIDARAGERYRGEVEPMDPRAGHIPGAVNRPATDNLADGRFNPPTCSAPSSWSSGSARASVRSTAARA